MKLTEVLSTTIPYKWNHQRDNLCEAIFQIKEYQYFVLCSKLPKGNGLPERWEISFGIMKPEYRIDLTNTGNQFVVMGTIFNICKDWNNMYKPTFVTMVAKDDSRKTLYPKLIKKLYPNWTIKLKGDTITASPKSSGLLNRFFK